MIVRSGGIARGVKTSKRREKLGSRRTPRLGGRGEYAMGGVGSNPLGGQRTPGPKGRREGTERLEVVTGPIFDTLEAISEEEEED